MSSQFILVVLFFIFPTFSDSCEQQGTIGSVGSNAINLNPSQTDFVNDVLTLSLSYPSRYNITTIKMSGAPWDKTTNATAGAYHRDEGFDSIWSTDSSDSTTCTFRAFTELTWSQFKDNQFFRLLLVEESDEYYFVNRITVTLEEELPMTHHFRFNFTRTIEYEIPWMFILQKTVELELEAGTWKYSDPPSATPSHSPSSAPVSPPSHSPTLVPTPLDENEYQVNFTNAKYTESYLLQSKLGEDSVFTSFGVVEPNVQAPSYVKINFKTITRLPYLPVFEEFSITDPQDIIYDNSEKITAISPECEMSDYVRSLGYCVDDVGFTTHALMTQASSEVCFNICESLGDKCEAYDAIHFTDELDGRSVTHCEVIGRTLNYQTVEEYPNLFSNYSWTYYMGLDFAPTQGNGFESGECFVKKSAPVWQTTECHPEDGSRAPEECYCEQTYELTYKSDELCDVSGELTLNMALAAEFTVHPIPYSKTISIFSQMCAEIAAAVDVQGAIDIHGDHDLAKYYEDEILDLRVSFQSGMKIEEFELDSFTFEQILFIIGKTGQIEIVDYTITSQSIAEDKLSAEIIINLPLNTGIFFGGPQGVETHLYVGITVGYEGIKQRRRLVFTSETGSNQIKLSKKILVYPGRCANPLAKQGEHMIHECKKGKFIQVCSKGGVWETMIDRCHMTDGFTFTALMEREIWGTTFGSWWNLFDIFTRCCLLVGIIWIIWKSRKKSKLKNSQ